MKLIRNASDWAALGLAVAAGACEKGFTDLNTNPNQPTEVPVEYILPEAFETTLGMGYGVSRYNYGYGAAFFSSLFCQHWASIQYTDADRYDLGAFTPGNLWYFLYANSLKDWQTVIDKSTEIGLVNREATGRVMKVFTFHFLTDVWGDVPYSEALQGDDPGSTNTPAYDRQKDIYASMVSELGTALELIDPGARSWGPEDLIYGGDMDAWARFANSLRLRLGMRMAYAAPAAARAAVQASASHAAGLITDNAQNGELEYRLSAPNQSPLFYNARTRDDFAPSKTLVDYMAARDDPRLPIYAEPAASDGQFRGAPNGVASGNVPPLPTISRIGNYWRGGQGSIASYPEAATTPTLLVTAAEVHFLLAEAALRGWSVPGTARNHYEAGVRAAMDQYDGAMGIAIPTSAVEAYLAQPGVAWGTAPSGDNLELIIGQKWLALYTNGFEGYAEYRRTGYPAEIAPGPDAFFPFVPGRIPYPDSEQSLNRANWEAALAAQGIDGTYTGKVWWMR